MSAPRVVYVIRFHGALWNGQPMWLRERPAADGTWRTRELREARVYLTRRGAERWLEARPWFIPVLDATVEEIASIIRKEAKRPRHYEL